VKESTQHLKINSPKKGKKIKKGGWRQPTANRNKGYRTKENQNKLMLLELYEISTGSSSGGGKSNKERLLNVPVVSSLLALKGERGPQRRGHQLERERKGDIYRKRTRAIQKKGLEGQEARATQ